MILNPNLNNFIEDRLAALYQRQLVPALLVLIGFVWLMSLDRLVHSPYYTEHLIFAVIMGVRILGTLLYYRFSRELSEKWLYRTEFLTTIFMFFLGSCYSLIIYNLERVYGEGYSGFIYFLFFLLILGALRTSYSSFMVSLGIILGSCGTLFLTWIPRVTSDLAWIFTYVVIPFCMIYLIKSQYDEAIEFVIKVSLLREKEQHIYDLQQKIALEDELRRQKEANIHSARLASLGEMASGISHEINNPLAIISMNIQAMKIKDKNGQLSIDDWRQGLENIKIATDRTTKIMNSLRIFARDERMSNIRDIPVADIIELTTNLVERRFKENNIDLIIEVNCLEDQYILVNEVAISQVLVNLLNNSFYVLEKNEVDSRWCKLSINEVGKMIHFSVSDNGPGIPREVIPKLFVPFFTTKPPGEGTGVGLSMSKSMMRNMNGDLIYDSSADNTLFIASIPKSE